jgi:hypothetical protein
MSKIKILHIPSAEYLPVGSFFSPEDNKECYRYEENGIFNNLNIAKSFLNDLLQAWNGLSGYDDIFTVVVAEDAYFIMEYAAPVVKHYGMVDHKLQQNEFEFIII